MILDLRQRDVLSLTTTTRPEVGLESINRGSSFDSTLLPLGLHQRGVPRDGRYDRLERRRQVGETQYQRSYGFRGRLSVDVLVATLFPIGTIDFSYYNHLTST